MQIKWQHIEDLIFSSVLPCIQDFAEQHPDEVFYGFFLDCNAEYFDVLGHFNTPAMLHKTAIRYQTEYARLYPGWSVERLEDHLRWSAGDWGYFEVFNACDSNEEYRLLCDEITDYVLDNSIEETEETAIYARFMETCCRVAIRLERENAFQNLKLAPDFRVLCADHDESMEDAESRLQSIRKSMNDG
ncbi:DUF4303 domain-containing protein [Bremerella sp.]|uniref:DUF4303 domain-containing protein n=1 Tax=Bremerella sp. TaxID=2795602 RepID=UPI00391DF79F